MGMGFSWLTTMVSIESESSRSRINPEATRSGSGNHSCQKRKRSMTLARTLFIKNRGRKIGCGTCKSGIGGNKRRNVNNHGCKRVSRPRTLGSG